MRMVRELECLSYEDSLKKLGTVYFPGLCSLEESGETFHCLKGDYRKGGDDFVTGR